MDPSGTDPGSETARLLAAARGRRTSNIGVFQSQTAAWAAAADGAGVAPAIEHLVSQQLRRGELSLVDMPGLPAEECWHATLLERERRSTAASALRRFLGTPEAMQLMRSPAGRRAAVPVQAPGLRHHLELKQFLYCADLSAQQTCLLKRQLIWLLQPGSAGARCSVTSRGGDFCWQAVSTGRRRAVACVSSPTAKQGQSAAVRADGARPQDGQEPTVWAWPELVDYLKIAGQPVSGPWPPHQEPRPDPDYESGPQAVADPAARPRHAAAAAAAPADTPGDPVPEPLGPEADDASPGTPA